MYFGGFINPINVFAFTKINSSNNCLCNNISTSSNGILSINLSLFIKTNDKFLHIEGIQDEYILVEISRELIKFLPEYIGVDVINDEANKQFIIKLKL